MIDEKARKKCLEESLRVLKKGGYFVVAYIPRLYLNQMIAMLDVKYVDEQLLSQIKTTGVLKHNDPNCFWTDTYYSSYDEMQALFRDNNLDVVMHFAQDGMSPLFHNTVDMWNDEQFDTWLAYHLSVCAEKTIIDMSNHVVIIGKKN